jgi:hypothetical protein
VIRRVGRRRIVICTYWDKVGRRSFIMCDDGQICWVEGAFRGEVVELGLGLVLDFYRFFLFLRLGEEACDTLLPRYASS